MPPTSSHSKTIEADKALEENRYSEAVQLYREAILLGEEERASVGNMHIAEDLERVAFCMSWLRAHPSSGSARLAAANAYLRAGMGAQSFQLSQEALSDPDADSDQQIRARLLRFRSAVTCRNYHEASSDYSDLWIGAVANPRGLRRVLLKQIAALDRPDDRILLNELLKRLPHETHLCVFLARKAEELKSLAQCLNDRMEGE